MLVSYNKLWKMLIDKKITKIALIRTVTISSNVLAYLSKEESISVELIEKIYLDLSCTPNDILEISNNLY